ncbi:hypothetical protein C8R45DRAFT_941157 [Mycena sanguinolenta]|nr:hypothetical protein C8R45DRAFT_941157 [Mycena sanguinolenta]
MSDTLIFALVVCLILTNLSRFKTMFLWVWNKLAPPPGPQMVPYFDDHACVAFESPPVTAFNGEDVQDFSDRGSPSSDTPNLREWSGWPNGQIQRFFTLQQLSESRELGMNWVVEILKQQGSRTASTWKKGQETRRRCLGAIECHGRTCGMVLEPSSRGVLRHRQLENGSLTFAEYIPKYDTIKFGRAPQESTYAHDDEEEWFGINDRPRMILNMDTVSPEGSIDHVHQEDWHPPMAPAVEDDSSEESSHGQSAVFDTRSNSDFESENSGTR